MCWLREASGPVGWDPASTGFVTMGWTMGWRARRMPRTIHRLSAVKVASLAAEGLHPDGNGLYLRITKTGTKSWIYRYSISARSRDMGLGAVCAVSLSRARQLASECRRLLSEGHDPIRARETERVLQSMAAARNPNLQTVRRGIDRRPRGGLAQCQAQAAMAQYVAHLRLSHLRRFASGRDYNRFGAKGAEATDTGSTRKDRRILDRQTRDGQPRARTH